MPQSSETPIFTGRNEVVAKVMFLLVSVIVFTGGVSTSVHAGIPARTPHTASPGKHASPPPEEQTPAYGQWAAGTHPTGMRSCYTVVSLSASFLDICSIKLAQLGKSCNLSIYQAYTMYLEEKSDNVVV